MTRPLPVVSRRRSTCSTPFFNVGMQELLQTHVDIARESKVERGGAAPERGVFFLFFLLQSFLHVLYR
jgi:hypothetical protein